MNTSNCISWLSLLCYWALWTVVLHRTMSTFLTFYVYLSSFGDVLFTTFNTQGQVTTKILWTSQRRRLFGVGRALSCEFRTQDNSLAECSISLTIQSCCLLCFVWLFLLVCLAVACLTFWRMEKICWDFNYFHTLNFDLV